MTILVEKIRAQDFVIHEEDYRYTRVEGVLTNDTGAELDPIPGLLLAGAFTPHTCDAGSTTVTGILLSAPGPIAAAGTAAVAILNLGPAVVCQEHILDVASDVADAGSLADLADLGIKVVAAVAKVEEGSPAIP